MDRFAAMTAFVRVVETGSFTRAAEDLALSRAMVSMHVSALEREFGARLLLRTTRNLAMTDEGRVCYERSKVLLQGFDDLQESVAGANAAPKGMLRVNMPSVIGRILLSPAIPSFIRRYPDVSLRISLEERLIDVVEEGADVIVRIGELKDSSMIARHVHTASLVMCATPEYLARAGVPKHPDDLAKHQCLGLLNANTGRIREWHLRKGNVERLITPSDQVVYSQSTMVIDAAMLGLGIICLLDVELGPLVRTGKLVQVLPDWHASSRPISILYPRSKMTSTRVRAFVEFMAELFPKEGFMPKPARPTGHALRPVERAGNVKKAARRG